MKSIGFEAAKETSCKSLTAGVRQGRQHNKGNLHPRKPCHASAADRALEKAYPDWAGESLLHCSCSSKNNASEGSSIIKL